MHTYSICMPPVSILNTLVNLQQICNAVLQSIIRLQLQKLCCYKTVDQYMEEGSVIGFQSFIEALLR